MGITHDVAPALYVARLFFVLPFTKFDHGRLILRSPLWLRFLYFIIHLIFLIAYIFYAYTSLQKFKQATNKHSIQESSVSATLFIMQCVDILNTTCVLILSQRSCDFIENILKDFVIIEQKIIKCKPSKNALWISVYMCGLYVTRVIVSYVYLKRNYSLVSMSPSIASAALIAMEHLLFVLCLEIRKYLRCINENLKSAVKIGHIRIARLSLAYDMLSNAQDKVNKQFGLFLLLDLSQLLFNILYLPLWTMTECVQFEERNKIVCTFQKLLGFGYIFFTYVSRVLVLLCGCSWVASEAERTAVKSSSLIRRNMDKETKLELHTLLELSLSRRLSFSACGLFTIDIPLLFAAGGAVTSYLVLITQLK